MKTIVNYAQKVKEQHALNKTLAPVETDLADASRSYAIGEQFINDGNLFKAKTPIAQHDALVLDTNYEAADDITTQIKNKTVTTDPVPTEGSTNPVQSNGVFVENRNIYEVMGKNGAKNLSKPINSTTYNGITVVCDSDGVLTVTGTASASGGRLNITGDTFTLKAGTYKVVQNSDDLTKYASIVCHRKSDNTSLGYVLIENGTINNTNAQFTLAADTECFLGMNTYQGTDYGTGAGTKEYAMVVLADDTDTTYQPYAKTNQQLTAENEALTKEITDAYALMSRNGAKNHVHVTATSQTINGVTFTVDDDGSIKANGTATEFTAFDIETTATGLKAVSGNYLLSDGLANPSASHYTTITVVDKNDVTTYDYANTKDAGKQAFSIVAEDIKSIYLAVCIGANVTVNDLVFYPMVRDAEDIDSDFQPYAKTNQQLTAENQTLTNDIIALDGRVDEKGIIYNVETTADGVKTYSEIFKDLFDDIKAYLTEKGGGIALITSAYIGGINISAGSQDVITKDMSSFIITGVGLSGSTKIFQLYFHTSNANGQYTEINNSTSAITYKNFSNDVPAQDTYFRVRLLYFST